MCAAAWNPTPSRLAALQPPRGGASLCPIAEGLPCHPGPSPHGRSRHGTTDPRCGSTRSPRAPSHLQSSGKEVTPRSGGPQEERRPCRAGRDPHTARPTGTQRPTQRQQRQRSPQRGTDGAGGAEKPNPSGAGAVRVGARPPGCDPDSVVASGLTRSRAAPRQSAHRAERCVPQRFWPPCAPLHHLRGRAGMWHPANSHPSPLRHGNPRRERSAASRSLHVAIWEAFQLLHS